MSKQEIIEIIENSDFGMMQLGLTIIFIGLLMWGALC